MRPTFALPLALDGVEFYRRLQDSTAGGAPIQTVLFEDGAVVRLVERHEVWSPALHLHIVDTPDQPVLKGRFCPSSPVWTAFLAIYLSLACLGIASTCWGISQWMVGADPWALIGLPVCLALAGFTFGAAFIGQGLSAADMHVLRSHIEQVSGGAPSGVVAGASAEQNPGRSDPDGPG